MKETIGFVIKDDCGKYLNKVGLSPKLVTYPIMGDRSEAFVFDCSTDLKNPWARGLIKTLGLGCRWVRLVRKEKTPTPTRRVIRFPDGTYLESVMLDPADAMIYTVTDIVDEAFVFGPEVNFDDPHNAAFLATMPGAEVVEIP